MRLLWNLGLIFSVVVVPVVSAQQRDVLTPVVAQGMQPSTSPVRGTDGRQHFVYELVVSNAGTAPASIQKLEVISGDTPSRILATFEGKALSSRLHSMGHGSKVASEIEFNGSRLFLVDFAVDAGTSTPTTLLHRFQLLAVGPPGSPPDKAVPHTYTIAPIAVDQEITVLGPPLEGKGWAAVNGCCGPEGVHRGAGLAVNGQIHFAQRFAIDWMLLDANARFAHGSGKKVTDYTSYGAKVIAVADGTVVETLSTLDDQVPGNLPDPKTITLENVDGNHIVMDLGHGKYAFYAHLQKGSLLVAQGDHVKRGQPLALLGNTGNTSAPHLHFHLMDSISVLGSSGLPYVIDHFDVAGQMSAQEVDASELDAEWSKNLFAHPSSRESEFPLDLTIVNF